MKRILATFLAMFAIILLAACSNTSKESIVKKLSSELEDMTSYKMEAKMTMHTGKEARTYDVEVLYKKEDNDHFKVTLMNEEEKTGQIILKNNEGVFVLTPDIKKTFKFQSEWPENSSQPYLYQSVIRDIMEDKEATFTEMDDYYLFEAKTNYEHQSNLPSEEIYINKKTLLPQAVHVLDEEKNTLIEVIFSNAETDVAFDEETFHKDKVLESLHASVDVEVDSNVLEVQYPLETFGATLVEEKEIQTENGKRIIMTFEGEDSFTLIQENEAVKDETYTEEVYGEMVEMKDSVAAISNGMIEWTKNGIKYYVASETMSTEQLTEVANSLEGKGIK